MYILYMPIFTLLAIKIEIFWQSQGAFDKAKNVHKKHEAEVS